MKTIKKIKQLFKALFMVGIVIFFSVGFIAFVLFRLSAISYVVLLAGLNVFLLWYFIKGHISVQEAWDRAHPNFDIKELRERIEVLENDIEELKNNKNEND